LRWQFIWREKGEGEKKKRERGERGERREKRKRRGGSENLFLKTKRKTTCGHAKIKIR
jgi:hypothetical protein